MKSILNYSKNKINLIQLQEYYHLESYEELVELVEKFIQKQWLEPVKSSKGNGKRPVLYNTYRILKESRNLETYKEELLYLSDQLKNDYYLNNLNQYEEDRPYILQLNQYMLRCREKQQMPASFNERSFEIFSREKFLTKEGGLRILKNLGLNTEKLKIYETTEPLAYYSNKKNTPQTLLFIENKDTFYSMRRHLLKGNNRILGEPIGTLIYGGGKGVYRSIQDFDLCVEPYMNHETNQYLYFGDLDYEGIFIYEKLKELAENHRVITPFVKAYETMLAKSVNYKLPATKEKQNRNRTSEFFSEFSASTVEKMKKILEADTYIPQEILQEKDFLCAENEDKDGI
ncbi:MAG: DUF2220 family protein [Acetivibrio sp.]